MEPLPIAGLAEAPPAPPPVAPPAPALGGRVREWTKILTAYFSAQSAVQLLGIGAGLIFVNFMPVREFALYTLAASVITFFTFATDLGSSSSLVYFFRRAATEGGDFRRYFAAALSLRRTAFLLGVAVVVLAFPWMALGKGFDRVGTWLATIGIALCVWFQIEASLRVLALRLEDRYGRSYRAELAGAGLRTLLAALMAATSWMAAWLGVVASALAAAAVAGLASPRKTLSAGHRGIVLPGELARERRQILRYLLPSLPSAIYFSVQGPLVVWLAAAFGSARNIAEVGALSRLGLVVGVFSGLTGIVFLPRLARVVDDRHYRTRYLQYGGALLVIALSLLLGALLFPRGFLLLLGEHYAGLHRELVLVVGGGGLTVLGGYAVGVNLARAWNRWETLALAALIAAQVIMIFVLPLSTTSGVLLFNVLSGAVGLAGQAVITAVGFWRPRWVKWM